MLVFKFSSEIRCIYNNEFFFSLSVLFCNIYILKYFQMAY